MGQSASTKTQGGKLSVKNILSHKKKTKNKMDKHKNPKDSKDDDNKITNATSRKPAARCSKGVAMSFGFKKRPTPMTTNNTSVAWSADPTTSDKNGNEDKNMHKMASSQKQSNNVTPRQSRFSFQQTNTERTTKKATEVRASSLPHHFPTPFPTRSASRRTSPSPEAGQARALTRNVTIITRTEVFEDVDVENGRDGGRGGSTGRVEGATALQANGKFTFQTTRLPQPEPIRVIETKTAKTIANNNKKSQRMWQQCNKEATISFRNGASQTTSPDGTFEDNPVLQERLQGHSKNYSLLETSDSFSDACCTPPPLPELPPVFGAIRKLNNTNKEIDCKDLKEDLNSRKLFLKSNNSATFLKNRRGSALDRDSPQSSSDQEWINGGEAMADQDVSPTVTPKYTQSRKSSRPKSGELAEAVLQSLLKPSVSLEMIDTIDSLKESMNLSLFSEEDTNFIAMATSNTTGALLDDEILSPVESLLSASETEDILKKKMAHSSSTISKDVNEKLTPISRPDTPNNATLSLSLSDDKDDFLIDDEIADQPELVFEDTHISHKFLIRHDDDEEEEATVEKGMRSRRASSFTQDFSPLPLRKKKEFLHGSFDSLSPCDSIGSEDLMMDFDISQTNDAEVWESNSLEGTPKSSIFKKDDSGFNNKNFFKSLTPKKHTRTLSPSNSHKSRGVRECFSPECRSPIRRNHFHPFGFQSMTYDPTSESLTLTRANHSAIQQDIIGIKTMLLTLKRVLNESESHSALKSASEDSVQNINNNNNSEFRLELADLRRQVLFLQGQLEDKEKTVSTLQKQIDDLAIKNTREVVDNVAHLNAETQNRCNAATQTERGRPLVFSLTTSPIEDNNPILRLMIK